MSLHTFRLQPRAGSGFHFGRQGREIESSTENWGSDSLFSALTAVYRDLGGNLDCLLASWIEGNPQFVISSLFPIVGDLPLFPMPRLLVGLKNSDPTSFKQLKKLQYVSPGILQLLLTGAVMDVHWQQGPMYGLQNGAIWIHSDEQKQLPSAWRRLSREALAEKKVWEINTTARVTVDRTSAAGGIYLVGRTIYSNGCGLWCMASISSKAAYLQTLLEELGCRGAGGERNAGYGAFTLGEGPVLPVLPDATTAPRIMTLARYSPRGEELVRGVLGSGAAYELVNVGGWLTSPDVAAQRRRRLRMIEVGSVLVQDKTTPIVGQLVDVKPVYPHSGTFPHPVYRAGFVLPLGAKGSSTP